MSEHTFLVGMLALHLIGLVVIGYMGFRVHQASQRIEGISNVLGRPR